MKKSGVLIFVISLLFLTSCGKDNVADENSGLEIDVPAADTFDGNGEVKEIEITAKNWEFDPSVITVNKGDKVRLRVKSLDVAHGISIPDFVVNLKVNSGEEATAEFVAGKTGTFDFRCNVYCGEGHGDMKGTLVVN